MTHLPKSPAALLLVALGLGALAACSTAEKSLDGTKWQLTGWTLSSLNPADFAITAQFDGERISGNSGVNSYSGTFKFGPGDAFSVGPIAGTRMAGSEPAMRAETAFLTLLGEARSARFAAGQLTLRDANGVDSLIFAAAAP